MKAKKVGAAMGRKYSREETAERMPEEEYRSYREQVYDCVKRQIDTTREWSDEQVRELIDEAVLRTARDLYADVEEKRKLGREIFHELRGYGVLQELLEDETVTEIMVNGPDSIFIERNGVLEQTEKRFLSAERLEEVIQQMVSRVNRTVNDTRPIADIRLADGSRANIVLNSIALNGPALTIRKFPREGMTLEKLKGLGAISEEAAVFLTKLVEARYNIFISGGTGSGKTTFLNALSQFIPREERIITIEDSAELQIRGIPNLISMEVRNANIEGDHEITIRDLIKTALRMRPTRIIIGEIRDQAAFDLLSAWNTGHDGSLSTGHANSPGDMLSRLESLALLGADIPLAAIRKQIASALDLIIHVSRMRDRTRKVTEITEVLNCQEGEIEINQLYVFEEEGVDENGMIKGRLRRTSNPMIQLQKLRKAGIDLHGL